MKQLIKTPFIFDSFTVYELLIYIVYIYSLIVLFIYLKPNIYNLLWFSIYVLITSKIIVDKCNSNLETITKNSLVVVYVIGCCAIYYFIHTYKKIIFKSKFLMSILVMLPFIYFFNIKMCQLIFNCHRSYVIDLLYNKSSKNIINNY